MCYVMDGLWRVLCDCRYVECCVIGGMWKECCVMGGM